mmetsp:Transcript_49870/g.134153  ORF Transcript_49870/g.134153 Transcript_49870/m.134153 type:complete len:92 (+) Transcript_49870:123-398(+)
MPARPEATGGGGACAPKLARSSASPPSAGSGVVRARRNFFDELPGSLAEGARRGVYRAGACPRKGAGAAKDGVVLDVAVGLSSAEERGGGR